VGVAVLAYTLGLRHAFDADHISAIDNCTRKVLGERQGTGAPRPLGFGFFSLGLSVAICFVIGGIEVLSLLPQEIHGLSQTTGFWGFMYNFNINTAGFIIVGMFILTWLAALLIWRFGRIEERWTARLQPEPPVRPGPGPAAVSKLPRCVSVPHHH
jgi:high-affinity nickel permease